MHCRFLPCEGSAVLCLKAYISTLFLSLLKRPWAREAWGYPFRGRDEPETHCNAMGLLAGCRLVIDQITSPRPQQVPFQLLRPATGTTGSVLETRTHHIQALNGYTWGMVDF